MATDITDDVLRAAVVQVGEGRGFVMEVEKRLLDSGTEVRCCDRVIVTAAHCLPKVPQACSFMFDDERTERDLIGPLGAARSVWAQLLFVDPIADLAVLGQADSQQLPGRAEAYDAFVDRVEPFVLGSLPEGNAAVSVLSLDGRWISGRADQIVGRLYLILEEHIVAGMSGSPILDHQGAAIGVVSNTTEGPHVAASDRQGPQPMLARELPVWLVEALGRARI